MTSPTENDRTRALGWLIPRRFRNGPRSRYAAVAFLGQVLFAAITLGSSLVIARLLGPSGKGEYTAWTLVTLFGSLILAGTISTGFGRAYLRGETRMLARNALVHGGLALGVAAPLSIGAILFGLDAVAVIAFVAIAVPANVVLLDLLIVFQASKRPVLYQAVRILKAVTLTGGLILVAVFARDDARDLAYGLWATGTLLAAFAALYVTRRHYGRSHEIVIPQLARLGRGSLTTNLVDWMLLRSDQFLVLWIVGSAQLGIYSVAVNVAEVALYAANSIGQAMFEDRRTLDDSDMRRVMKRTTLVLAATAVVVAAAGFLLIGPVFGSDFADARWPLLLLVPGMIARGIGFAGSQMLLARGHGRALGRTMAVLLALDLALTAALAALIGIEGAALASSIIYVIQALLVFRLLGRPEPNVQPLAME